MALSIRMDGDLGFCPLTELLECLEDRGVLNRWWILPAERLYRSTLDLSGLLNGFVRTLLLRRIFLLSTLQVLPIRGTFGGVEPVEIERVAGDLDAARIVPEHFCFATSGGEQRVLHLGDRRAIVGPLTGRERDREFCAWERGSERGTDILGGFGFGDHDFFSTPDFAKLAGPSS